MMTAVRSASSAMIGLMVGGIRPGARGCSSCRCTPIPRPPPPPPPLLTPPARRRGRQEQRGGNREQTVHGASAHHLQQRRDEATELVEIAGENPEHPEPQQDFERGRDERGGGLWPHGDRGREIKFPLPV